MLGSCLICGLLIVRSERGWCLGVINLGFCGELLFVMVFGQKRTPNGFGRGSLPIAALSANDM